MTQKLISIANVLSLEVEHGQFHFLAPGGWTMSQFPVARIPELIALLHLLQRECAEQERELQEEEETQTP